MHGPDLSAIAAATAIDLHRQGPQPCCQPDGSCRRRLIAEATVAAYRVARGPLDRPPINPPSKTLNLSWVTAVTDKWPTINPTVTP